LSRFVLVFVLPTAVRSDLIQNPPVPFSWWHNPERLEKLWQQGDVYHFDGQTSAGIQESCMEIMLDCLHSREWIWDDHPFDIGDVLVLGPIGQYDLDDPSEGMECYMLTAYDGFKPIEWVEQKHPEPALP